MSEKAFYIKGLIYYDFNSIVYKWFYF